MFAFSFKKINNGIFFKCPGIGLIQGRGKGYGGQKGQGAGARESEGGEGGEKGGGEEVYKNLCVFS